MRVNTLGDHVKGKTQKLLEMREDPAEYQDPS